MRFSGARTGTGLVRLLLSAMLVLSVGLTSRHARAIEYEVFIDIEEEEDLYDLLITEQIDENTFDELIDVLRQGIDLNTATRDELYALPNLTYDHVDGIIAYRNDAGRINDPADLVVAGVVPRRILAAIAPFLLLSGEEAEAPFRGARGFVRYRTMTSNGDQGVPPMALQGRVTTARHLTVGGAFVLDRNRIAPPKWDPNRQALTSTGEQVRPRVAKIFARWETDKLAVIGGTYRIGFGQRLVFDTSGRYTPNGLYLDDTIIRNPWLQRRCRLSAGELPDSPCAGEAGAEYHTPDYRVPEGMRGVAVGFKKADLPKGWMQGYGWFSSMNRTIYQYQIYNRDVCDDPRSSDPMCGAPPVYLTQDDPLEPTARHAYQVLPNMYNEHLGGANVGYWYDKRTHVGITGYGATAQWLVDGADLDFQNWSRFPHGGPWGAIGADASWGHKWADFFLEVAHSFDSQVDEGNGGPAVIARHTATVDVHEVEVSARYYDHKYANPYARPISAPDQFDGLRARDEVGGRIRYNSFLADRLSLRSFFDMWMQPTNRQPKLLAFIRGDVQATKWFAPGLWLAYQNRDLRTEGRDHCFIRRGSLGTTADSDFLFDEDILSRPDQCRGERVQITGRMRFDPHKRVYLTLQYRHNIQDDRGYSDRFQQDIAAFGMLSANPIDPLRFRMRIRYDFEDISDRERFIEAVWGYAEVSYRIRRWLVPRIRYDVRAWLDDRARTALRSPNPEHWVHFELESRF
jgi:hypothetical protein